MKKTFFLIITLISLIACTPETTPEINTTIEPLNVQQTNITPSLTSENTSLPDQPTILTEKQQKRILHGQYNFSLLSAENCENEIILFYKIIIDAQEELQKNQEAIARGEARIDTLLEQLGQSTQGTNAWKRTKDDYDKEQYELDGLLTQQRLLEKKLPDLDYTADEMKQDCKLLKAQPLNR